MPATVVVGLQWGDEAKGKIVDYLASDAFAVVRYNGGNNAGHTVVVGDQVYKFHTVPAGILHTGVRAVIADGVVIDPSASSILCRPESCTPECVRSSRTGWSSIRRCSPARSSLCSRAEWTCPA